MTWPRARVRQSYTARMYTFSWPKVVQTSSWKDTMFMDTLKAAGSYVRKDQIRSHFEVSSDGYEHCHLVVGWSRPTKCDSFYKIIQKWQAQVGAEQRSNACHVLPKGDKESARLGLYQVMINYVTDPKKQKIVDEEGLTWTHPPVPVRPPDDGTFWWQLTYVLLPDLEIRLKGGRPRPVRGVKRSR